MAARVSTFAPIQTKSGGPTATPAGDVSRAVKPPQPVRSTLPAVPASIPVYPANHPLEAEADAMAGQTAGPRHSISAAGHSLAPPIVHAALRSTGRALDDETRASMEPALGHGLGAVRLHADSLAEESARALDAQAYTVGQDIFFDAGRYNPRSGPGQELLAHELAHTVQQETGGLRMVQRQPNDLASYPEAERHSIRQVTTPTSMIDAPFLMTVFGTAAQNGGAKTSYNFGGQTIFGAGVPGAMQNGLTSTGAYMANQTNLLPLGSTVTIHLDLRPFQGPDGSFRFSNFTHTEPHKPAAPILLIESSGAAPSATAPAAVPTGNFTVRNQTFSLGGTWTTQQFGELTAVLNRLPDAAIQDAAGITFLLQGMGTQDEAGKYQADKDQIVIHQNAFTATNTSYGGADQGMYSITHEVGHLLDLRRLERAWRTFNTGGQTAAGKSQLLNQRSVSGSRWRDPGNNQPFEQADARTTVAGQPFREAAQKDGIKPGKTGSDPLTGGPTAYSNTDWQELFAESFALYVNDPNLFRILRPNLHQFFIAKFPLPATATPATGGAGAGSGTGSGGGSGSPH